MFDQLCCESPDLNRHFDLQKVDISLDAKLQQKYGLSIPVFERGDTHALLYWPFPASRLREFLS